MTIKKTAKTSAKSSAAANIKKAAAAAKNAETTDETPVDETATPEAAEAPETKVKKVPLTRAQIYEKSLNADYLDTKNQEVNGVCKKILMAVHTGALVLTASKDEDENDILSGDYNEKVNVTVTKFAKGKSNRYTMKIGDKLEVAGGFASKCWRTVDTINKPNTSVKKVFDAETVSSVAALLD